MLSFLLSFGAAVGLSLKRKILIIGKNFLIGGKENGKQLLNSHQKEQSSTTMSVILAIPKEEFNHANLLNGVKPSRRLITILPVVTS